MYGKQTEEHKKNRVNSFLKTVNTPGYKFPRNRKETIERRVKTFKRNIELGLFIPHSMSKIEKEIRRKHMLAGKAVMMRKKATIKRISIPQKIVFNKLLKYNNNLVMEYAVKKPNKKNYYYLDIADVDNKINIEYDGSNWHQDREKDLNRDKELSSLGWQVYRMSTTEDKAIELLAREMNTHG